MTLSIQVNISMNTLDTLIVEDEKNNADLMVHFLEKYCPTVRLQQCCLTQNEALKAFEKHKPDLMFLDIVLDQGTAFDLLNQIDHSNTQIVFVTAYDQYALKAFRYHAVDYLLKPIGIDELIATVNRVQKRMENHQFLSKHKIENIAQSISGRNPLNFVTISNLDKVNLVKNEDILYCKSSGRYTEFYLKDAPKLLASKSLGEYEKILENTYFFRIHKSYLVNLSHIININKKAGNYCELINGSKLPISRRRLDSLIQYLKII